MRRAKVIEILNKINRKFNKRVLITAADLPQKEKGVTTPPNVQLLQTDV